MEQMPQQELPRCQGISGTFIRPSQTFKEAAAHIALSSPTATSSSSSSAMSIRKDEESSGGYFSYKPRSPAPGSRAVASECDREIATLMVDADIIGKKGAMRWRKVATTMPKSLWKADIDAITCDHLSTIGGACEKPFGRFLGKYRLPSWSPSLTSDTSGSMSATSDGARSSTSSLWGSVKTIRKTQCWRCGNCFCDDHSSHFATLILDHTDAMPYLPAEEEPDTASDSESVHETSSEIQQEETDIQAPVPFRTATMALSQYLASSSQQPEASTSSLQPSSRRQREQLSAPRTRLSSTTSRGSSVASEDWQSSFTGSDSSAVGRMDTSTPASTNASADCSPVSSSLHAFPSKARKDSDTGSLLALSNLGVRAPSPMSERMAQIPDGRIIVRERVCLRCHDIVESARSLALEKQAELRANFQEFVAQMQDNGVDVILDLETGELAGGPEYVAKMNRIFNEYRRGKKEKIHSFNHDNMPSQGRHAMSRQQSGPSVHYSEDDYDDTASSTSGHSHTHYSGSHAYPNRAYLIGSQHQHAGGLRRQVQGPHQFPPMGMGGQRLQFALAPYERESCASSHQH